MCAEKCCRSVSQLFRYLYFGVKVLEHTFLGIWGIWCRGPPKALCVLSQMPSSGPIFPEKTHAHHVFCGTKIEDLLVRKDWKRKSNELSI